MATIIRSLLLGVIFINIATLAFMGLILSMDDAYDTTSDRLFNETFSNVNRLEVLGVEAEESISNPAVSASETEERGSRGALSTLLSLVRELPSFYKNMIQGVAQELNLNKSIANLLVITVSILLIFGVIAAIFKVVI